MQFNNSSRKPRQKICIQVLHKFVLKERVMNKCILAVSILLCGLLVSACGNSGISSLLPTKINSFKATIGAAAQTPPVTIAAATDVKFDWSVDTTASTYNANLYVSSTTSPVSTPLFTKVSTSGNDSVTCKTDKTTVPGKTFMTCTGGVTNAYDVTSLVGTTAYMVLQVNGVNAATDKAAIQLDIK
jgi:hypothetical protein